MIIYLYVKIHKITGLKYLGKTIKDPYKYKGSGVRWNNHLKVHGNYVETQILRECKNEEELQEWGLYYSKLYNVVEDAEWANLIEEYGNGFSSESAKKVSLRRVKNGTHNFLGGELQKNRVKNGTHNFLGGEISRKTNAKRVKNGTHNFLGGEITKKTQRVRIENGTHHFLGGEISRKTNAKRVKNGTHNFLDGDIQRKTNTKRVENGTHNFLGGENNRKRLENGTHSFQIKWICEHCDKSGKGIGLYKRWHGSNCKLFKELNLAKS